MPWIDHHCHVPPGATGAAVVDEARAAGVARLVSVGTDLVSTRQMVAIAREHTGVYATAGVHPHDAAGGIDGIAELLDEPEVVAVGECGLDFHYDNSPRDAQAEVFAAHIRLANRRSLPLVIHSREAWDETFRILDREGVPERTVFHCFTGGPDEVDECLARGALVSFSGIVTFPSADDVRAAAARCPVGRMLVETDSPYLAPVPHRGKPNRPAWVPHVGQHIADLRDVAVTDIAAATTANAEQVFAL